MPHAVLLGDSIFDNASYVPGGPAVIEQLANALPSTWHTTLLAIDGSLTEDVVVQLKRLPEDATHLVISTGGNDALGHAGMIEREPAESFAEVLEKLGTIGEGFRTEYRAMLVALQATRLPVIVCTVYDSVPGLTRPLTKGLALFNDIVIREAARAGVPILDLRLVCADAADYSTVSPIEPSVAGGNKITQQIARVVTSHDFTRGCAIYS